MPSSLLLNSRLFSSYKNHTTLKGRIVCVSGFILVCKFLFRVNEIRVWVNKKTILILNNVFFNFKNIIEILRKHLWLGGGGDGRTGIGLRLPPFSLKVEYLSWCGSSGNLVPSETPEEQSSHRATEPKEA
ncbi:hypothetical protein P5673_018443 [Acropora cervicornis]|uniref:Uncharacterized protein n=1 Tax=Acropora cervicornis TaxID=6130 RepID=A0AAD9V319_ACRCE|nr:hypothetical protein P5673_018443 [Acropora cervicornis]